MEPNPLRQYFRQPSIYIQLPSGGEYWAPGSLDATDNGEYPVFPMTTMDEITYRTPDALFNGTAVVSVVQSCMPNIRNAWDMPSLDIDTILVAIRIATYGHNLDISTKCPNCSTEADYGVDLRKVLEQVRRPNYSQPLILGDLQIYLKPMVYREINANSMSQFEDQKSLQVLEGDDTPDDAKLRQLGDIIKKITQVSTKALAQNIACVLTPQAQVTEYAHIGEWLTNSDRATYSSVRDHIIATKSQGELQPLNLKCANCGHEYEQSFTLDMSNFFADAS